MNNRLVKNVVFGFGSQFIIIILGLIVPRIMITGYGSDINGLTGTITQIFTYVALLEAGIGQAARNSLYKPIAEHDESGISYVLSVAQRYYRRITVFYGVAVVILACVLPFLLRTNTSKLVVSFIVICEGMSGVFNFYFIQTPTSLLIADGKGYVNNGVNALNRTMGYLAKIVLASIGAHIVILEIVYFSITICKTLFYQFYVRKKYSWIDYSKAPKNAKLKDRNAYIVAEIAWTLFSSTDLIVLSIFVSTKMSSVYSVYNMVFNNLHVLLNAVYTSVIYVLGRTYHENIKRYTKMHDGFTSVFLGLMTALMCVSYFLIIPFIKLYTRGVTDIEYVYPSIPIYFCLIQMLSWSRYVSGNLTCIAGYAKETGKISVVEAITNIVVSIILVPKLGISGVLIGSVVALPLKVLYCTYICENKILKRSPGKYLAILGINFLMFGLAVIINSKIQIIAPSYTSFFLQAVILTVLCLLVSAVLNTIVNRDCLSIMKIAFSKAMLRRR